MVEKIKYKIESSKTLNDDNYRIKKYETKLNEIKDSSHNKDKNEALQLTQKINN